MMLTPAQVNNIDCTVQREKGEEGGGQKKILLTPGDHKFSFAQLVVRITAAVPH